MGYTVIDAPQRSPEWFQARCGRLTASSAAAMTATIKSGEAAARRDLRLRLVIERITGHTDEDGFVSGDMLRGIELEGDAIDAYEAHSGNLVQRVGFLRHNNLMIGCSPDGIIDGGRGGVEVKAPKSATHYGYLKGGRVPSEYVGQLLHSMLVTGAEYWDFASYDPRFPEHLRLFVCRMPRVEMDIAAYQACAQKFLEEVDAECAAMAKLAGAAA